MQNVCQNQDIAVGHRDILGNQITGIVTSSTKCFVTGIDVARNGDNVHFPTHPHALDGFGNPINYRTHDIPVTGTGKFEVVGEHVAVNTDVVPVADEAGPNANMVSTQFILSTS